MNPTVANNANDGQVLTCFKEKAKNETAANANTNRCGAGVSVSNLEIGPNIEKNIAYAKTEYVKKSPNERQRKKNDSEY